MRTDRNGEANSRISHLCERAWKRLSNRRLMQLDKIWAEIVLVVSSTAVTVYTDTNWYNFCNFASYPLICFVIYLLVFTYLLTYLHTDLPTALLTYLLTLWSRVLLEKLIGSQLVKKFPALYGTRRFIAVLTSACHLSLSKVLVQFRNLMYEQFVTRYVIACRSC